MRFVIQTFLLLFAVAMALTAGVPAQAATFAPRGRTFPVGPNPCAIAVQDLNEDGWPEIVTADRGTMTDPREERPANDELSLLIAQGKLDYVKHHPSLKTGFAPYAIAIANIDALKWPDIVVVSFHAVRRGHVNLFLNLRNEGIFKPVMFKLQDDLLPYVRHTDSDGTPIFTRPGLTSLAIRDINRDGLRDLVATGWASDVLLYMPGDAETYFGEPRFIEAKGGPRDVQLADFDHDGKTDLAVVMYVSGELTLWRGDGAGGFEETARFPTRGDLPNKVRATDVNGDGILDLVVSHRYTQDSVVIFYGDGDFSFTVSQEIMLGEDRDILEHEIEDIVATDLNGDGRTDIAAACSASGKIIVLLNESKDNARRQEFRRETYTFEGGKPHALAVSDFDHDGNKDIAVALWDLNAVGLLMGQG